jgi:sulfhydrogenase subunit beta (sulfur reductase)
MTDSLTVGNTATISRDSVQALLDVLVTRDFEVIGPTVRDGAIVYDRIARVADLPVGWTDRQDAGRYRLERRDDDAFFGFNVGPQAWKRFLHRPVETLWTMAEMLQIQSEFVKTQTATLRDQAKELGQPAI